jgi:formate dehydrogenase maturation protein FdhE
MLLVKFGNSRAQAIVEAEICPDCGVYVKAKQLGRNDEGFYLIPSALGQVVEDL